MYHSVHHDNCIKSADEWTAMLSITCKKLTNFPFKEFEAAVEFSQINTLRLKIFTMHSYFPHDFLHHPLLKSLQRWLHLFTKAYVVQGNILSLKATFWVEICTTKKHLQKLYCYLFTFYWTDVKRIKLEILLTNTYLSPLSYMYKESTRWCIFTGSHLQRVWLRWAFGSKQANPNPN